MLRKKLRRVRQIVVGDALVGSVVSVCTLLLIFSSKLLPISVFVFHLTPVPRRGVLYSPARGVYSPRSPPQIAPAGGPSPGHPARVTPTQIFSAATKSNGMCASVGFNISFETSARSSTMQVLLCSTGAPSPGESWNVCRPTSVASPPRVPHRSSVSERDSTNHRTDKQRLQRYHVNTASRQSA